MKAHHTQTHAPLRGHASSLLRAGAPGGGRCRIGSSLLGHRVGEGGRPQFGLSGVSLSFFFFFCGPPLKLWEEEGECPTGGLLFLREHVSGTKHAT